MKTDFWTARSGITKWSIKEKVNLSFPLIKLCSQALGASLQMLSLARSSVQTQPLQRTESPGAETVKEPRGIRHHRKVQPVLSPAPQM